MSPIRKIAPETKWASTRGLVLASALLLTLCVVRLHGQTFTDLWDFDCGSEGCNPINFGQFTQASDGNLYGTLSSGGPFGNGGIVMLNPANTSTITVWTWNSLNQIYGGLTFASDGNFYGTTAAGGTFNHGTAFRFSLAPSLTVLHNFNGTDGDLPLSAPVQGKDGNLYGVTGIGTTYRITLSTGKFTKLPNNAPSGTQAPLLLASDGNLYGTSVSGGSSQAGTVFRMTTAGAIKVIYSFTATNDGVGPEGPLTQAADGSLYGTTEGSTTNTPQGNIFKVTLSGQFTVLHNFDLSQPCGGGRCNNDGADPIAGMAAASDGNFYGVTPSGGTDGYGTLFELSSGGSFSKLFDFTWDSGLAIGAYSSTTLMQHTNGCLYGLAYQGGNSGGGNAYSLCPARGVQIVKVAGPIFVLPGVPVQVLGNNLTHVIQVNFAGEPMQFQIGSDTVLSAQVPNDAVDGLVSVIFDTGLEISTQSVMHVLPVITNLDPSSGPVGTQVNIVGGGFAGTTKVTFGGARASSFSVLDPTHILVSVPANAKTGKVKVTTPNGTATSKQTFTVN